MHCLKIGTGGSIIGGGGPTGNTWYIGLILYQYIYSPGILVGICWHNNGILATDYLPIGQPATYPPAPGPQR